MTTAATPHTGAGRPDAGSHGVRQVIRFYERVDSGDALAMSELFAPGAVYTRPGYEPFIGPAGLLRFYTELRTIREGGHVLDRIVEQGDDIAVFGEFHGVLHSGAPVDLRFADYFGLGSDGRFVRRDTYFFAPLV
ncbi:nuclear transport factor 2 family protein [Streptomyces sp. NPDC048018]|uniref:nuclear transport factor 2 family protein n=1 Tax=Streptomyces sp. NPDC048018 TaxID=3365499 RepID=UPI003716470B